MQEPEIRVDALVLRTLEINPTITLTELSDRLWYAYGVYIDEDEIQQRINVYHYDHMGNHLSLN